jgi:nitric oxide reductase subunit B
MELLKDKKPISHYFIVTGLILLFSTLSFGVIGALQYVYAGLFRENFSFEKIRPLHVSSAVFWILITACGAVIFYLGKVKDGI